MPSDTSIAIVLAAGKGTRMESDLPKVLFPVLDRPMIEYVIDSLMSAGVSKVICVVGYRADLVREKLSSFENVEFVEQTEQLGTGHAVMVCKDAIADHDGATVVVAGDSPLLQSESVSALLAEYKKSNPACILGTLKKDTPFGLGRIVRNDNGDFEGIVEEKDATEEQRKITEVNMSTYVFDNKQLLESLDNLSNDNQQGEYYITDCPGYFVSQGKTVSALPILKDCESLSINTIDQLALVEAEMKKQNM